MYIFQFNIVLYQLFFLKFWLIPVWIQCSSKTFQKICNEKMLSNPLKISPESICSLSPPSQKFRKIILLCTNAFINHDYAKCFLQDFSLKWSWITKELSHANKCQKKRFISMVSLFHAWLCGPTQHVAMVLRYMITSEWIVILFILLNQDVP